MAIRKKDDDVPEELKEWMELLESGGGAKKSSKYPGPVYMGEKKVWVPPKTPYREPKPGYKPSYDPSKVHGPGIERGRHKTKDQWVDAEEAVMEFNSWNAKKRGDFIAQAKIGGLMQPDGGLVEAARLWRMLVEEASFYGKNKEQKIGPWDILSTYVKASGGKDAKWMKDPNDPDFEVNRLTGDRRYVGPQFKTTTESRIDLTDPGTAAAIATRIFQDLMGRDPGQGELTGFAEALNTAEAQNPVTATTTTEFDPVTGKAVGTDTITEGGLDAAAKQHLAQNRVKGTEEYGVVQAATTYSNALENAVWGAPELESD